MQATKLQDAGKELGRGIISELEWLNKVSAIFKGRFSQSYIRDVWNMVLGPMIPGMKNALEFLFHSKVYRFAYFSDTSVIHMKHFFRTNELRHIITAGIFSYEVGVNKPGDAMYEAFENELGIPFFYTDDTLKNIDAAVSRGWRAEQQRSL